MEHYLQLIMDISLVRKDHIIIEGIHLDPPFNKKMMKKYENQCLCLVMKIDDIEEYRDRSWLRVKLQDHEDIAGFANKKAEEISK